MKLDGFPVRNQGIAVQFLFPPKERQMSQATQFTGRTDRDPVRVVHAPDVQAILRQRAKAKRKKLLKVKKARHARGSGRVPAPAPGQRIVAVASAVSAAPVVRTCPKAQAVAFEDNPYALKYGRVRINYAAVSKAARDTWA